MIKPILLFKLGAEKLGVIPTDKDIENFKKVLDEAITNDSFDIIVTHFYD